MTDRILFNSASDVPKYGKVDEIVVDSCMFHIEQMDKGHWFIGVYKRNGEILQIWLNDGELTYETDIKLKEDSYDD